MRNGDWSHFDPPQTTRQLCHGWKARQVKVKDLRHVSVYQPEGVATRRVPGEQNDTVSCDATQLGEPCNPIVPVVYGQDGQGRVEGGVRPRQVLGNRLHNGRCAGRALLNHRAGRLHCHHLQVGGLIGACASTHIEYRARFAQRRPNGLGNPEVWLAGDSIAMADLVVYAPIERS